MQGVDDRVGVVTDALQLVGDAFNLVGVGVTYGYDGVAAIEVEIFSAFVVPDMAAFAFRDVHVEKRIDVE